MTHNLRELRYVRYGSPDKMSNHAFFNTIAGLEPAGTTGPYNYYRSDSRSYSVCIDSESDESAVGLTISSPADLDDLEKRLTTLGIKSHRGRDDECALRKVKEFVSCKAPNGVSVEFVLRPMTSGWRFFPSRDAGVVELQSVSMRCVDVSANESFWTDVVGGKVSDWIGDAAFIRIDDAHHRIALYPSNQDGLMGINMSVEDLNNVMQSYYFFQSQQLPIVHGPGYHPPSEQVFVTTEGPQGILLTFATGMVRGVEYFADPPRQYRNVASSHCGWGSHTLLPEFGADTSEN